MRISDWSSDVCSSDLPCALRVPARARPAAAGGLGDQFEEDLQELKGVGHAVAEQDPEAAGQGQAARGSRRGRRAERCLGHGLRARPTGNGPQDPRSEEHTSELQSLMRISYAVFCLKKKHTKQAKLTTTS